MSDEVKRCRECGGHYIVKCTHGNCSVCGSAAPCPHDPTEDWWVVIDAAIPQAGLSVRTGNPSLDGLDVDSLYFGPFDSEDDASQHACEDSGSIETFTTIDADSEGWSCADVYVTDIKPKRAQHVAPYLVGTTEHWTKVACGLTSEQCTCSNEKEEDA